MINKKEIIYSSFPLLNNLNLPDYLSKKQDKKPEIISTNILSLNNTNSLINIPKNQEKRSEIKEPSKENNVAISIPNLVQIKNNQVNDNIKSISNEIQINQPQDLVIPSQNISKDIPINIISNPIPGNLFQSKLIAMSENYVKIKAEVEKIAKNPTYKARINDITYSIKIRLNQISTNDSLPLLISEILSILSKNDDLYKNTIDYVCNRIITKAEGYNNDKNIDIFRLGMITVSIN